MNFTGNGLLKNQNKEAARIIAVGSGKAIYFSMVTRPCHVMLIHRHCNYSTVSQVLSFIFRINLMLSAVDRVTI